MGQALVELGVGDLLQVGEERPVHRGEPRRPVQLRAALQQPERAHERPRPGTQGAGVVGRLQAEPAVGAAQVTVSAAAGTARATQRTTLAVRPSSPPAWAVEERALAPGESGTCAVPDRGVRGSNRARLSMRRGRHLEVTQRARELLQYPHACLEQMVSAAFPQLYLAELLHPGSAHVGEFVLPPTRVQAMHDHALLDHEYTQRSLSWSRLKNSDAARAAALREVAARLDCGILLALADVHETWSCEDDEYEYGRYGRHRGYAPDEDEDEDEDEVDGDEEETPILVDRQDVEIDLHHPVGSDPGLAQIVEGVTEEEVCVTRESVDLEPFASEHQGCMGNYGNTVDRWYHRAAVVLWPRERTFVLRARASAYWAMDDVANNLRAGQLQQARQMAERLLPFWAQGVLAEERRGLAARTLEVAAGLDTPELAAALLQPFALERLTPDTVRGLLALVDRYGGDWTVSVVKQWAAADRRLSWDAQSPWLASLPDLCRPLCADQAGGGLPLAQVLVAEQCAWAQAAWQPIRERAQPRHILDQLKEMGAPVVGLLESCLIAARPDLHQGLLRFLSAVETGSPIRALTGLLRTAQSTRSREALRALGLGPLHAHCARELAARLSVPALQEGDWSIPSPIRCTCELCTALQGFLADPDRARLEWPLAEARHAHVHGQIDAHDLPVDHTTRRVGRPYTLVLTKTRALFAREAAERETSQADRQWLEETAAAFGEGEDG
ncbi:MAG: 2OG-Fe(II) oxygenase [Candidatus Latescibacterota bacterium]